MRKIIISFLCTILFLVLPLKADAHLGGGPPFLKVDGKDAQTNPYNQGQTGIVVPWDLPPDTYLVNKPVTFVIDVSELMKATTVPESLAKDIKFHWSIASGDNFDSKETTSEESNTFVKTFPKIGSYLVLMEAKLPADSEYILIDSVQVNIVPTKEYSLPFASVYIGTQNDEPRKNVLFVSDSTFDTSTKAKKYIWDFDENSLRDGKSINLKLERVDSVGVQSIFHRVIDENGFVADTGFVAQKESDKLRFSPFTSLQKNVPITVGTYAEASAKSGSAQPRLSAPQFLIAVIVVLALAGGGWWFFLKKRK